MGDLKDLNLKVKKNKIKKINFFQRKYLINKNFQFTFLLRILFVNLSTLSIVYALNYYLFYRFNDLASDMGLPVDHYFYEFLKNELTFMSKLFSITSLILCGLIGVYSFFLSHRIVGPLENIKNCFKRIEDLETIEEIVNVKEAQFREDDFFKEFAISYNKHLEYLKNQLEKNHELPDISRLMVLPTSEVKEEKSDHEEVKMSEEKSDKKVA